MAQNAPPHDGRPQVPQTTAALLEEMASLRRQNEEQRRELEHLRGGAVPPPLGSSQPVQPPTMHLFNEFPTEIREMIWELALPRRIVGTQDIVGSGLLPVDQYVPAVGQVCRESRRFASSRNPSGALLARCNSTSPTPAGWTWFSTGTDALMVAALGFEGDAHDANHVLARAAEHIIVEDSEFWGGYYRVTQGLSRIGMYGRGVDDLLGVVVDWVQKVYAAPRSQSEDYHPPICSLRTVDFAMRDLTQIPPDSPPQLLRRLFGDATFRVVDLRDMDEFLQTLCYGLSQGVDQDLVFRCIRELGNALDIYRSVADKFFIHIGPFLLKALVSALFEASNKGSPEGQGPLPVPFKPGGSKLDMEVAWVRKLSERLIVRPVHVFVLGEVGLED